MANPPSRKPRVLVVEDDFPIRSALEVALRGDGYDVQAQPDGTGIEQVAAKFRPDLAVLDVRLPTPPDGFMIARLLRMGSDMPMIFLTAADAEEHRLEGFKSGGDDYLVKPFSMAELRARIEVQLRRSGRLQSATWQVGDLVVDEATKTVVRDGHVLDLTQTEYKLLNVFVRHHGKVLSKLQLMTQVWGFDAEGYDPNIVEVHVSALRKKLEVHGPRLVHTMRGLGYVLRGE